MENAYMIVLRWMKKISKVDQKILGDKFESDQPV